MFTKLVIGVDCGGGAYRLTVLGRRFRRYLLVDELQLPEPRGDDAPAKVAAFLDRHHLRDARVIACLPRDAVLVRFLSLPQETEPQLAKVVDYQLGSLHPYKDGQVYWDCAVVERDPKTKQITVMVVLAEKPRVNEFRRALQELGLRLSAVTLCAATMAALLKSQLPPLALVACGRGTGIELLSFHQGNLCATQEIAVEPAANLRERFERERHRVLAALPMSDPAAIPWFISGPMPPAFSALLEGASPLPPPKLNLRKGSVAGGVDWAALSAAYAGLVRRGAASIINLLPQGERWPPHAEARLPVYALSAVAFLLALTLASHAWIERTLYSRALDRELHRLNVHAQQIRGQNQETSSLEASAAVLENVRASNLQKLHMLQELTRLLPDGTWLQEVDISEDRVEINGYSNHAADLVRPLETSPYFTQVEFSAPITRDNQSREVFRIRMRLKQALH